MGARCACMVGSRPEGAVAEVTSSLSHDSRVFVNMHNNARYRYPGIPINPTPPITATNASNTETRNDTPPYKPPHACVEGRRGGKGGREIHCGHCAQYFLAENRIARNTLQYGHCRCHAPLWRSRVHTCAHIRTRTDTHTHTQTHTHFVGKQMNQRPITQCGQYEAQKSKCHRAPVSKHLVGPIRTQTVFEAGRLSTSNGGLGGALCSGLGSHFRMHRVSCIL